MNPDRIWRELGSKALARQASASSYGVFVAMPFRNQFSYRSDDVFASIIVPAVARANTLIRRGRSSRRLCAPTASRRAPVRLRKRSSSTSSLTTFLLLI